jgi:hypothetical protein
MSSDTPTSATAHWTRGSGRRFKKSFNLVRAHARPRGLFRSATLRAAKAPDAGCARQTPADKSHLRVARKIPAIAAAFWNADTAGRRARWPGLRFPLFQPEQFAVSPNLKFAN